MTGTRRRLRRWLKGATAILLAVPLLALGAVPASAQGSEPGGDGCEGRGLPPEQVGIQQFTYRGVISSDGVEAAIANMAEVGMTTAERFGGTFGLDLADYAALWDDYGVRPVGSHGSLSPNGFDAVLADALTLGQEYVGSGGWAPPGTGSLDDTLQTAANMNLLGEMAADEGLTVYGHNHDGEFSTMYDYDLDGDGTAEPTRVIEILMAETDPDLVAFEIDVHWARIGLAGGRGSPDLAANLADPANQEELRAFGERHADRIELLHVKDTAPDGDFAEVGQGTTDWAAFFDTVPNVRYYFIEHDTTQDPFATAEIGFNYLTCELYGDLDAGSQELSVTVPEIGPGEFVWSIQGDGSVDLGVMVDQGSYLQATGPIDPIEVTDTRAGGPTWSISGQASDFGPGLGGHHLGWSPEVLSAGAGAVAGAVVDSGIDGGDGLSVPATVASAASGHDLGTAEVGADLDLRFPAETEAGGYTATLTITALS